MNDIPTLSVVIPIYNGETTVDQIFTMIDGFAAEGIEVILINDGSTDRTKELCETHLENHSRVRLINKENGGVSSARNIGIDQATGDYITFLDADDQLEDGAYRAIQDRLARSPEIDLYMYGMVFSYHINDKVVHEFEESYELNDVIERKDINEHFFALYENHYLLPVWNKVFRRSMLVAHHIRFDESLTIYEDFEFSVRAIKASEHIYISDRCLYRYINDLDIYMPNRRPDIDYRSNMIKVNGTLKDLGESLGFGPELMTELGGMCATNLLFILDKNYALDISLRERKKRMVSIVNSCIFDEYLDNYYVSGIRRKVMLSMIHHRQIIPLHYISLMYKFYHMTVKRMMYAFQ